MLKSKKALRKEMLAQRNKLSEKEILIDSNKIWDKIISLDAFKKANKIFLYKSIKSEVSTQEFIEKNQAFDKIIAYPVTNKSTATMDFYAANNREDFKEIKFKNTFILEPDSSKCKKIEPDEKTLVILPGLAFDMDLNRTGYGGGFYDRFLKEYEDLIKTIGVCYDFQIVKSLFTNNYDMPVNKIVSPNNIIK